MKKILAMILAIFMLATLLVSCKDDSEQPSGGDPASSDPGDSSDEITGCVMFRAGEKTSYAVLYQGGMNASVKNSVQLLVEEVNTRFAGADLDSLECFDGEELKDNALEILIGDTNRPESAEAKATLTQENEFVLKLFENGKLVICATDTGMLKKGVEYFLSKHIKKSDGTVFAMEFGFEYHGSQNSREGWGLTAPSYYGGELSDTLYNIGSGAEMNNAKGGMMQIVRNSTAAEFDAYVTSLKANADYVLTQDSELEVNGNQYVQFQNVKNKRVLYCYYTAAFGEVRVIEDYVSAVETDFEYTYEPKAGEYTTVYSYGLMYDPRGAGGGENCSGTFGNCGQFYIIRLADGGIVLIDGGAENQANTTQNMTADLLAFLREISGVSTGKVRIAAVYLTHPHGDHKTLSENLIRTYSDELTVERAIYNMSSSAVLGPAAGSAFAQFGTFLKQTYPDLVFVKPHTGQRIRLADIQLDIIYTHEDMVDAQTAQSYITEGNNLSTVTKFTINGKTLMLLGDVGGGNDEPTEYRYWSSRFLTPYKTEDGQYPFLECDVVQVAHHAINYYMSNIYHAIKADIALFTQSDCDYNEWYYVCYRKCVQHVLSAGATQLYFQGRYTTALTFTDTEITVNQTRLSGWDDPFGSYQNGVWVSQPITVKKMDGTTQVCATYGEMMALFKPFNLEEAKAAIGLQ